MPATRFSRYELQTTDVRGAEAFYTSVLGGDFWGVGVSLAPLPERAASRGAPARWLGHVGTPDVDGMAARLVALGGQQLGPTEREWAGPDRAVLRDPFGAVLALSSELEVSARAPVAWHLLHCADHERAFAAYAGLFGWVATEVSDLGPDIGCQQHFAWEPSGPSVGGVANTARLPHVHPHWMYCFRVSDIEGCLASARAHGGKALPLIQTSSADLVAACDDPQGAAFGLYQLAPART
jgi:uncharacterized protein